MATRLAAAILVFFTSTLSAQDIAGQPQRWGTASDSIHTTQAFAFDPTNGAGAPLLGMNNFAARFCSSTCSLVASVTIPSGVSLRALELEACDLSATGEMTATLFRLGAIENGSATLAGVATGVAATPGCSFFSAPMNHTVDNFSNSYILQVIINGTSVNTRFQALRLFYRLQVSPAPATATFTDVPASHFAFRFVEALAASGITGGCGAGTYCPDAPLTRAQMAIFLATALGLHFPD